MADDKKLKIEIQTTADTAGAKKAEDALEALKEKRDELQNVIESAGGGDGALEGWESELREVGDAASALEREERRRYEEDTRRKTAAIARMGAYGVAIKQTMSFAADQVQDLLDKAYELDPAFREQFAGIQEQVEALRNPLSLVGDLLGDAMNTLAGNPRAELEALVQSSEEWAKTQKTLLGILNDEHRERLKLIAEETRGLEHQLKLAGLDRELRLAQDEADAADAISRGADPDKVRHELERRKYQSAVQRQADRQKAAGLNVDQVKGEMNAALKNAADTGTVFGKDDPRAVEAERKAEEAVAKFDEANRKYRETREIVSKEIEILDKEWETRETEFAGGQASKRQAEEDELRREQEREAERTRREQERTAEEARRERERINSAGINLGDDVGRAVAGAGLRPAAAQMVQERIDALQRGGVQDGEAAELAALLDRVLEFLEGNQQGQSAQAQKIRTMQARLENLEGQTRNNRN